jgi:uncharacterized protein YcbX
MIGVVSKLWRYPVKSMLGEECRDMELDVRGVRGDRLFAVRDADGKLGSGKNTRRFRQIDGLFGFRANYARKWPEIRFPDGRVMAGDDPRIHEALSEALGVSVTLVREAQVSHLDAGPVHIVSTGALAWLRSQLPDSRTDERRFRPNILVTTPESGHAEQSWLGKTLRIGPVVKLEVTAPTKRCRMTTLGQSDLPDDPRILRCIAQVADLPFGVYAHVQTPGRIAAGDAIDIESRATGPSCGPD